MLRTVEGTIDEHGNVMLNEAVLLARPAKALVTIVEADLLVNAQLNEAAILAEKSLKEGWTGKEADEAWVHLAALPDLDQEGQ